MSRTRAPSGAGGGDSKRKGGLSAIMASMSDELDAYMDALARDECYRVEAVLKESACECTQKVWFVGANGAEQGPYVRKYIEEEAGLGAVYERIWEAQRSGRRFLHLPRIEECYRTGRRRAVVMEFVGGETLSDVVYRCDPSFALAADVFPKLCDAVSELHEAFDPPIVHRDLKPANIMLSGAGLTVIDFGIARTFRVDADEDTRHFGTRAYAPPEQFGYGQTDVRSDVYALGLLLYFLLTERTPDARARRACYKAPGVPEPLRAVVERAASFDPASRYESAAALKAAFFEALRAMGFLPTGIIGGAEGRVPAGAAAGSASSDPSFAMLPASDPPASSGRFASPPQAIPDAASDADRPSRRFALGVAWDVLLALLLVLCLAAATDLTLFPEPEDAGYAFDLPMRAVTYYAVVLLMFGPVIYLVSDRRPLRRLVAPLRRVSTLREVGVCIALFSLGFLIVGIASLFD